MGSDFQGTQPLFLRQDLPSVWNFLSPILYSSLLVTWISAPQGGPDHQPRINFSPTHQFQFSAWYSGDCVSVCLLPVSAH